MNVNTSARGVCHACVSRLHAHYCLTLQVRAALFLEPNWNQIGTPVVMILFSSVHDAETFAAVPELPHVDCLPLPGSTVPISLTAQFAVDCLLRASATRPPLIRMRCSLQHFEEPGVTDDVLMLCAVRILAAFHDEFHSRHVTRSKKFRSTRVHRDWVSCMPS